MRKLYILTLLLLFLLTGCDREDAWDILKTRGEPVVEHITLPAFNAISVHQGINVVLQHGDSYHATVEGWKNLMPKIRISVDDDGTLVIEDTNKFNFVRAKDTMTTVYLTYAGEINTLNCFGDGDIVSNDTICTNGLYIHCEFASGSVDLKLKTPSLSMFTNHMTVAPITINGFSDYVAINIWGFNPVYFSGLKTVHADVHHRGTGNIFVNVSESLSVFLYSTGNIYYKGNPELTVTRSGKGNVFRD